MKFVSRLAIALFVLISRQATAQQSSNMQAMHMIKDFYTDYSSLNLKTADRSKLEALIDKYFTIKEGKLLKEGYKNGHDIMTNDSGITVKSLETMIISSINDENATDIETGKIVLIKGVKDAYNITYVVNPIQPKLNGITEQALVSVEVVVVKTNDGFKISYVTNGLTNDVRYRKPPK